MKILYAEDEKQLSMAVAEILKMQGYEVDTVYDGKQALDSINSKMYDAVILDIMMPKMDGIQVLKSMRDSGDFTPVMLLTAKSQVEDRINGLSIGADDYLGKPFDMREFLARIQSMTRRNEQYRQSVLKLKNIKLNCQTYELSSNITTLSLSNSESGLLEMLLSKHDTVFSIEELRERIFPDEDGDDAVRLYISYLRNKLTQIGAEINIAESSDGICLEEI